VGAHDIAIIGLAARVPGAQTPREFWQNLVDGVESITALTERALLDAGVSHEQLLRPGYVRAAAQLERMDWFDAEFFGISPKDAAIMDPQHRQMLEACWEALEDAGHTPEQFDGAIGVFGGCGMQSYFSFNLLTNPDLVDDVGMFLLRHTGNDKDFLVTRVSYLFDLHGPAINVQTACSTSLVATHLAAQHLLSGECDLALAGGVTIEIPLGRGYQYRPGEILSPDGHCRAFDHRAEGTVFGSGVGVVALRRLDDAIADRDQIYAVIRGTAVNNDGGRKVGYLAPSVDGQAACVAEALAVAGVDPESLQYIECHGTGTPVGDPIEVAALSQVFPPPADGAAYCRLGSVKTNIGHLDTAAGAASLIKVSLALQHASIPPSLNFEHPNPAIAFDGSPFDVNAELRQWEAPTGSPRRAGVNSLGVGGTNAFAVLEEAPPRIPLAPSTGPQLLVVSGKNRAALDDNTRRLVQHLRENPTLDVGDVAFTLHAGRKAFVERRVVVATELTEAAELLERLDPRRVFTHSAGDREPSFAFLLPGGGTQYPRMAADLYTSEPVFRERVDEGLHLALELHGLDLRRQLLVEPGQLGAAAAEMEQASVQLPCLLIVEHALGRLLMSWGIQPNALLGHSVGENVAACLAGTMSFTDCLGLVALRGRLMDRTRGGMIAVPLTVGELRPLLDEFDLDLAAVNAPDLCVASGTDDALTALQAHLLGSGLESQRVRIHIAAHSRLLEPVLGEFRSYLDSIRLSAPQIRWVSNRSGTWITDDQATDPAYWVEQLRNTVDFAAGVATVAASDPNTVFIEVGPGKTLSSLVRLSPAVSGRHATVHTMRHPDEVINDSVVLLTAMGRLWALGAGFPAAQAFPLGHRQRVSLPTYAFQSQRYFIEAGRHRVADDEPSLLLDRQPSDQWFWEPTWKAQPLDEVIADSCMWLVFTDRIGVGAAVIERLRARGDDVVEVRVGDSYQMVTTHEYLLAPEFGRSGYDQLLSDLVRNGTIPDRVVHLALLTDREDFRPGLSFFHRNQELGFYSLLFLAQAWAAEALQRPLHVLVATAHSQRVLAADSVAWPEQATVLGPALVMPHELAGVTVRCLDVVPGPAKMSSKRRRAVAADSFQQLVEGVLTEACAPATSALVALRGDQRYVRAYRRARAEVETPFPIRQGGVVLLTGGLGGIGLALAERLHRLVAARIVLLGREPMATEAEWPELCFKLGPDHPTTRRINAVVALRAAGADVTLMHGDVANVARMREVVASIRTEFGGLHAIVHAAGVTDDRLLSAKEQIGIEQVLSAKVYGTLVLEEITREDDLDLFAVFSSTSAVTGPPGQVDYVAANAFLNAFAQSRRGRVRSISWGVWAETGMAVDAVRRLLSPNATDAIHPCGESLYDTRSTDAQGRIHLTSRWSADRWFLDEHRTASGRALLPGAAYFELARQALAEAAVRRPFELHDLLLLAPLPVDDNQVEEIRTSLSPTDYGFEFEVTHARSTRPQSDDVSPIEDDVVWVPTALAQIVIRQPDTGTQVDGGSVLDACPGQGHLRSRQHDHLRLGPRWNLIRRIHTGAGQAVAELELPDDYATDLGDHVLHPAVLDIGLCFALEQVVGYTGATLWVPVSCRSAVVHRPFDLPEQMGIVTVLAVVDPASSESSGFATFDLRFIDASGELLISVEGFTMKRLDGPLETDELVRSTRGSGHTSLRQLTQAELVFRHNVEHGIGTAEGAAAFEHALRRFGHPELIVSSLDVLGLRAQIDAMSAASLHVGQGDAGVAFCRPQLKADYLAPRDAIEETLAGLWQELLGVSEIGVHDSFFDLGGHSLIAVRLFARIRKLFSVDLPISVLFRAQTVEACADLVRELIPTEAGTSGPARLPSRHLYLVPMHSRDDGSATPFFLVAGMFGNVLNLRHLASQIGTDRPFYGVQARGLFGDNQPHETFEEMAADYLTEVRDVQPHGPYMLAGFSGGGITALEMARQLQAAGEAVSLLVMLDTPAPGGKELLTLTDRCVIQVQNLRRHKARYITEWVKNRRAWKRGVAARRQGPLYEEGALHSVEIEAAFYRALSRYTVGRYDGEIVLLRPALDPAHLLPGGRRIDEDRNFIHDDNRWRQHCDSVVITEVPGDHDSMVLEPNVRVLAGHIRSAVQRAERSPSDVALARR
jgi:acyl transferase domain-containing protein/thioesterase domain-containing protein/acyl carrier protein